MSDTLTSHYKYRINELLWGLEPSERKRSRTKLHSKLGVGLTRFKAIIGVRADDDGTNATVPQLEIIADHFGVSMDYMCYRD